MAERQTTSDRSDGIRSSGRRRASDSPDEGTATSRDEHAVGMRDEEVPRGHESERSAARPGHSDRRSSGQRRGGRLTAAKAARRGLEQIAELTGREADGVAAVEPSDDGWVVGVEVVEDRRIPSSTDVLAIYQAELDQGGELVSYRRIKRYKRGQGDSDYEGESW